jgi:hypothetical protein
MRTSVFSAFAVVFVIGGAVLSTTVFEKPVAAPASDIQSMVVANAPPQVLSVREQNLDADGNMKVHEQGVADVNVTGVVTTQAAQPANSFSLGTDLGQGLTEGCDQSLPAGTRWLISSFAVTNRTDSPGFAQLELNRPVNPFAGPIRGPRIEAPPHDTVQLTFPQPFVLISPLDGICLMSFIDGFIEITVVGYRQ